MDSLILWILALASITGLTFIVERGLALRASKVIPPDVEAALAACRTEADLPMLRKSCEQYPSPLSRLILMADQHRHWPKAENSGALETSARHEITKLERGLVILEIIVGIAPLLGLVGTIYGLIMLFGRMGDIGTGNSTELSKGIALALNATLFGLITAIPSLVAWSYYNKKVETFAVEMASLCDGFLRHQYHIDDMVPSPDSLKAALQAKK